MLNLNTLLETLKRVKKFLRPQLQPELAVQIEAIEKEIAETTEPAKESAVEEPANTVREGQNINADDVGSVEELGL